MTSTLVLEGIEVIMFRTMGDGPSLWECGLPPELLRLPGELARVDALLDDPAFFVPFAPHFHPVPGRPSTPVECYLRLMFLKFRCRLGYESLCAEVSDSISWRRFCRIPLDGKVPHPTALMKLATRCGEQAVAGLNEALWVRAAGQKLLRTSRVRADTTVIAANVAYPADSGLLAKAVARLVRTVRRVQAAGGAPATVMTDRRRAAARRVREIAGKLRSRSKLGGEETSRAILRVTGELASLAEKTAAQASAVWRKGCRGVPRALAGRVRGRLTRALRELAVTAGRTTTIVAQTRTWLAGQPPTPRPGWSACTIPMPGRSEGPHRPPGRVRLQGPSHRQRRRHHPRLPRRVRRRSRRPPARPISRTHPRPHRPRTARVTADRGYGHAAVERDLRQLGVRTVAIPRQAKISAARRAIEHSRGFRRLVKWRTGCEGRISYLKHSYGWDCTHLNGKQGAAIWCGHGVSHCNLAKIGALAR